MGFVFKNLDIDFFELVDLSEDGFFSREGETGGCSLRFEFVDFGVHLFGCLTCWFGF